MTRTTGFIQAVAAGAIGGILSLPALAQPKQAIAPPTVAQAPETADHAVVEARRKRLDTLRAAITGGDRAARIATLEAALASADPALRQVAIEAALDARDPILGNLVLRDWLARTPSAPVQLYATKEEPGSAPVLQNLGPLTLTMQGFDPKSGAVTAQLSAPGYDVTRDSAASGTLAQTTLILNTFGCQLALQLSEHRMLDGLYRCRSLPALVARVAPH